MGIGYAKTTLSLRGNLAPAEFRSNGILAPLPASALERFRYTIAGTVSGYYTKESTAFASYVCLFPTQSKDTALSLHSAQVEILIKLDIRGATSARNCTNHGGGGGAGTVAANQRAKLSSGDGGEKREYKIRSWTALTGYRPICLFILTRHCL